MKNSHPIFEYRARHGLTLEQFGAMVGVKKAAVCKWEDGNGPSPRVAIKIEQVTGGELAKSVLRPDLWGAEVLPQEAAQ